MKKLTKMLAAFALLVGVFGVAANQKETVVAEAASTETKRVWLKSDYVTWWDSDQENSAVGIHFWGGEGVIGSSWSGVEMFKDVPNNLWYYDVPINTLNVKFTRIKRGAPTAEPHNKSINAAIPVNSNNARFELWNDIIEGENEGTWVVFTPATTTVVSNFAASIDTAGEACNATSVENALLAYSNLATFEKAQYDSLAVGEGFTGLQRLVYLSSFYDVPFTPSSARNVGSESKHQNISALVSIGVISLTSVAGYYFLKTKKFI